MSIEVMKQALTSFEWNYNTDLDNIPACEQWAKMLKTNISALRAAIEQAQEPVAWMTHGNDLLPLFHRTKAGAEAWGAEPQPLYTAPRQWQGLTDERHRSTRPRESDYQSHVAYTRALEAYCDMLEKNT